jgi:hypothetical protein
MITNADPIRNILKMQTAGGCLVQEKQKDVKTNSQSSFRFCGLVQTSWRQRRQTDG